MSGTKGNHLVLLVEDEPDVREVTLLVLEAMGYEAKAAENGQQALEQLRGSKRLPCLILLDLMMPIMNGWQFLKEIEKDEKLCKVPVVVLSAVANSSMSSPNVAEYLQKPATYEQLAAAITRNC